ncbi:MAG: alpha/beta fold hydrolase [Saprospiraceae bacterium]
MKKQKNLPTGFISEFILVNGITLHVIHNGLVYQGSPIEDDRKPLLCLHGFPEFWISWEEVMKELGNEYFMVVPDQRGCNKSDAPKGSENYSAKKLVADMITLAQLFFGFRKFNLAGHDFGAAIAYALVFKFPEVINKFIIVNGAHPICLQEALIDHPAQAEASQYFHRLREANAGIKSAINDFKFPFEIITGHATASWLTEEIKQRFREAWNGAERLQAMFNWYKSSPIIVPVIGQPLPETPLYGASRDRFRVSIPHLLIWGENDTAFLPEVRKSLPEFCDDLVVKEVEDADHWILHTHAKLVSNYIRKFLG